MRGLFAVLLLVPACWAGAGERPVVGAEEGVASFYADSLDGNATASGEKYDKGAMTAAHRTLAFGTKVRVTRKDNGKSVVVVINDRGPHTDAFLIDISGAAADKLDMRTEGRVEVELEILASRDDANENGARGSAPQGLAAQRSGRLRRPRFRMRRIVLTRRSGSIGLSTYPSGARAGRS